MAPLPAALLLFVAVAPLDSTKAAATASSNLWRAPRRGVAAVARNLTLNVGHPSVGSNSSDGGDVPARWSRWAAVVLRGGSSKAAATRQQQQSAGTGAARKKKRAATTAMSAGRGAAASKPKAKRAAGASASGSKKPSSSTATPSRQEAATATTAPTGSGRMPTLFPSPEEGKYDRYAACLAATEGLRRARDAAASPKTRRRLRDMEAKGIGLTAVSEQSDIFGEGRRGRGGGKSWLSSLLGDGGGGGGGKWDQSDEEEYRRASAAYVLQSAKIVRALGLTVPQFNQLGREVGSDAVLKERVMEQAYLYRMAATLSMTKVPLIEDPASERLLRAHRRQRVQMFARSMTEIEELRAEQTERLRRALNVDALPDGVSICDPKVQPLLSPKVRAVCEAFPLQAEEIIKKYGLNSDEFNRMLDETRANPIFRWRVRKYMGKSGEKK